ncbi:MAG TPA: F0F1 ATP synthase subunit delta [Chromatiales bacterium]|nr:F0F1 ATP synthase subunit delta [Chromatiales bacterium]
MAGEKSTVARPYAEAVFQRARETGNLENWSEMLELLKLIVTDSQMTALVSSPELSREELTQIILDVAGDRLDREGRNLLRLLIENKRLSVVPEIRALYETLKDESEGAIHVEVSSPFELTSEQEKTLASALQERLGREVNIATRTDPSLIGGLLIRAGDLVIDGSVQGHLRRLETELGI